MGMEKEGKNIKLATLPLSRLESKGARARKKGG